MALIVRITTSGQPTQTQRLERGRNKLTAARGARYEVVDETTGLAPTDAKLMRDGDTLRIDAPGSGINLEIAGFYAGEVAATVSLPGAAVPVVTAETALAAAETGSSGALLGILGGIAAVGGGVALAAGGGGSRDIPAPAPAPVPRDTTPPPAPAGLALDASDDSGVLNSDRITRTSTGLTITGTAEAGSNVELFNGSTRVGAGTASAAGTFSIDVTLPEGAATITARATDTAGNASAASAPLAITVDTAAPAAPVVSALAAADDSGASASDRITSQTSGLTVTGTAEAGARVEVSNGATALGSTTADASGNWTIDVTLPAGVASITARAIDVAGNASAASAPLAITVDTAAPAAPVVSALAAADDTGASASDRITSQTSGLTVTGTAEAGARVEVSNGATALGSTTADASGNWTVDITLPAGVAAITARAIDVAGNASVASAPLAITVDTAAPSALSLPTVSGGFLNSAEAAAGTNAMLSGLEAGAGATLTLSGSAAGNPATAISVDVPVANDGSFALSPATLQGFADGTLTLAARQTDLAGNAGPATASTFIVDRVAPILVIASSASTVLFGQTATIRFTFSEDPQGFAAGDIVVTGGTISGLAVDPANPRVFTATLTPTAATSRPITIAVAGAGFTDAAGNAAGADTELTIAYDAGSSGAAIDGYIANALVFRDVDNDGIWDREAFTDANDDGIWTPGEAFVDANGDNQFTAEAFSRTDSAGNFANLTGSGKIVLAPLVDRAGNVLTRDISTGGEFTKSLSAPAGSTVVTPLTTLVAAVAGANATAADIAMAETRVKAALGIDASVDLGRFDPISVASAASDATALAQAVAVQRAAVQVANVLAVVATAATSAGGFATNAEASQAAADVLATQFSGGNVDLANSATVNAVIAGVAATVDPAAAAAITAQGQTVATALASLNEAVASAGDGADAGAALAQIVAVQIVAQVTLSGQVEVALGGGTPVAAADFSGAGLAANVDAAAANVQVVVPVAPRAGLGAPDRPVVDDGTRISASELADGINVTVGLGRTSGAAIGDTLRLALDGVLIASRLLDAADVAAGSVTFPIAASALGIDGSRLLVADIVAANGPAGAASLPVLLSIDTGAAAPVLPAIAPFNAAAAASGRGLVIGGIEIGASVALTLSGKDALAPTEDLVVDVPRIDNVPTLTPQLLARFADGMLSLSAAQTDALGNISSTATTRFLVDRLAPAAPLVGDVSGGTINGAEAQAGVSFTLGGIVANTTPRASITGANGVTASLTANADGSYTLSPALLASLGQGNATVSATQTDAVGNSSPANSRTVLIDTVAPAAPAGLDLAATDDDGTSNSDNITRQAQGLTISGTAPALASVELRAGAVVLATTVANADGRFSTDISLPTGATAISAVAIDAAGNVSAASAPLDVRVLLPLPPVATLVSAELADGILDVSEMVARLEATGLDPALLATATVSGTRNGAAVTLNLVADTLDPAFGIDGRAIIDTSGNFSRAATALADGRVLVAAATAFSSTAVDSRISLLMVLADGKLDSNFGDGGRATVELFNGVSSESARNIVALTNGFAVLGSAGTGTSFSIARVDANGAPVAGFGNNGVVNFAGNFALNVLEAADGKIIVTGSGSGSPSASAMRLNADGSLDTSFGTAGVLRVSGSSRVVGAAFAPDGKLVLVSGNASNLIVTRYSPDGVVDTGFGNNGRLDLPRGASLVQPSVEDALGRIVITGSVINSNGGIADSYVARLNPDGTLDTGFGSNGFVSLPAPAPGWDRPTITSLAVGTDGKIALGGSVFNDAMAAVYHPIVVRLNADGSFDAGFDGNGIYLLSDTGGNIVPVAVRPDGSIVTVLSTSSEIVLSSLDPAQMDAPDRWRLTLDDHLQQLDPGAITLAVSQANADGTQVSTLAGVWSPTTGSDQPDVITGTSGADTIDAKAGNDTIRGISGTDSIDGGADNDLVIFSLPAGVTGSWTTTFGFGADAGIGLVQLVDGTSVIPYYRIQTQPDGSSLVEAVGPNPVMGTTTLRNVETIEFRVNGAGSAASTIKFIFDPSPVSGFVSGNVIVQGSINADTINVPTLYPVLNSGASFTVLASSGNDSVIGSNVVDSIEGGDGNDSIDGGGGNDTAVFLLQPGMVGSLRAVNGTGEDAGSTIVRRLVEGVLGEAVYKIVQTGPGAGTVQGLGAMAQMGTDTLVNVETLSFANALRGQLLTLNLATLDNAVAGGLPTLVTGSIGNDTIAVPTLYPTATASNSITLNGGSGDDVLIGHAGFNSITGGLGDDFIDGGAGSDSANFTIFGGTGYLRAMAGTGAEAGQTFVERIGSDGNERLFAITTTPGTGATIAPLNSAAAVGQGTDTVFNVETLSFSLPAASSLTVGGVVSLNLNQATGALVAASLQIIGAANDETFDSALFGLPVSGFLTVSGNAGNDTLIGHAGNGQFEGGAGDDSIDGGAGNDTALYRLTVPITGTVETVVGTGADAGSFLYQRVDGAVRETLLKIIPASGATPMTVTGFGPAASFGTDTLVGIETITLLASNGGTLASQAFAPIVSSFFVTGSVFADTIDLNSVTDAVASIGASGGLGDDVIVGTAGSNSLEGGAGNDSIDGGSGSDAALYRLTASITGTVETVVGTGVDAGSILYQRVDGAVRETLLKIVPASGSTPMTVTGFGPAASVGTDTLVGIETITLLASNGASLTSQSLVPTVNSSFVTGSVFADIIDLNTVPGASSSIGANGGLGNDTITGSAGSNTITGGPGDDVIDGGAGFDLGVFNITSAPGYLRLAAGSGAEQGQSFIDRIGSDGTERLFAITTAPGVGASITGINSAAAGGQGTDTLTNVERFDFILFNTTSTGLQSTLSVNLDQVTGTVFTSIAQGFGTSRDDTIDASIFGVTSAGTVTLVGNAGNDTLIGHDGGGQFEGGAGNDSIDGGAGSDTAVYRLISTITGTVEFVEGTGADAGSFLYQRVDGTVRETLLKIIPASGATPLTVTGFGPAASLGTDTLVGIETITLSASNGATLASQAFVPTVSPFFVTGSIFADTIDLNTVPGAVANIGANGGLGDDVMIGTAGSNNFEGGAGNDSIDGGAGGDNVTYNLSGITGMLRPVSGTGAEAGQTFIERVASGGSERLFAIIPTAGIGANIVGQNGAAGQGTDTLTNIEGLNFNQFGGSDGTSSLGFTLNQTTGTVSLSNAFFSGTANADTIDATLGTESTNAFVNVFGNAGDDTITGHAGSGQFEGGAGNDRIDGGAGSDSAIYRLTSSITGTVETVTGTGVDAGSVLYQRVDGAVRETLLKIIPASGATPLTVTGFGPAASVGTDTLVGIETITLLASSGGTLASQTFAPIVSPFFVTGSVFADTIDLNAVPGAAANIGASGGLGDDVIIGTAGGNNLEGGAGNDTIDGGIDGGAGFDSAQFSVNGISGYLRPVVGVGTESGQTFIERVDIGGNERLFAITPTPGSGASIVALNSAAAAGLGTDIVTNVEGLFFNLRGTDNSSLSSFLSMNINQATGTIALSTAQINGTTNADIIDVASIGFSVSSFVFIFANSGNDTLVGHAGNGQFEGGAGDDSIDGGAGSDSAVYRLIAPITGTVETVVGTGADAGSVLYQRVDGAVRETLLKIVPASGATSMTVTGFGAAASLGTDTLVGVETITLSASNGATLASQAFALNVSPFFVSGTIFADTIDLNTVTDASVNIGANGGAGNDTIIGTAGNNSLEGGAGSDSIDGGAGNDDVRYTLTGAQGYLLAVAGTGAEAGQTFIERVSSTGSERVFAIMTTPGVGASVVGLNSAAAAGEGTDTLTNVESLSFNLSGGSDGSGFLSFSLTQATGMLALSSVQISGTANADTIDTTLLAGAANVFVSVFGNDGNDMITGHAGSGLFEGGAGNDSIDGGLGSDEARFNLNGVQGYLRSVAGTGAEAGQTFIERIGSDGSERVFAIALTPGVGARITGLNSAAAGHGTDTLTNIERLSFNLSGGSGGAGFLSFGIGQATGTLSLSSVRIVGTTNADMIDATLLAVPSSIFVDIDGSGGDDTIIGHAGTGRFIGGIGNDNIDGGAGSDSVLYQLLVPITGTVETVTGTGADAGSVLYQRVDGAVRETLLKIVPASGSTPMTVTGFGPAASFGTDTLVGIETVTLMASNGVTLANDAVSLNVSPFIVNGSIFADTIDLNSVTGAAANIGAIGGLGDDLIIGTAGGNFLDGGAGNDILVGGSGRDSLTGGAGNDQFQLETSAGTALSLADVITDFTIGSDTLLLPSGTSFANLSITQGTGADSANTIIGTSAGTILAVLLNIEAAQITAASF